MPSPLFPPGQAPCWGQGELFFRECSEEVASKARAICVTCPKQVDCLLGAAERRERDGIWGGVSFWANTASTRSDWSRLLRWHQDLAERQGLRAVAERVVSRLRQSRGQR